jgi:competence/damage-inducible protein CinA-like protein
MPSAQILAIGTELLLGAITDTNTSYIARALNQYGIDIFRTGTIGDNEARIADEIRSILKETDILITTGGLGPTIDDPTRQAVALAFGVELDFHPELWEQIQARFRNYGHPPTENNRRQAFLPHGAQAIENPVGTAPAFAFWQNGKVVVSLPGVPSEMKTLLQDAVIPMLRDRFNLAGITLSRTLLSAGMGESDIDVQVAELEKLSNPTVGLAAHPGQVDIRITAKAPSREEAEALIRPVEEQVRSMLGVKIFGVDNDTLAGVLTSLADACDLRLDLYHTSSLEEVITDIKKLPFIHATQVIEPAQMDSLYNEANDQNLLVLSSEEKAGKRVLDMTLRLDGKTFQSTRNFGGHPALYPLWMKNYILSFIRETIIQEKGEKCKK